MQVFLKYILKNTRLVNAAGMFLRDMLSKQMPSTSFSPWKEKFDLSMQIVDTQEAMRN